MCNKIVLLLPVEMGLSQCRKKSISGTTYGRMRCSDKMYWSWSKQEGLSPGACRLCLIHGQVVQLHPIVEEVQPCLHQAREKGPEILCCQFSPFQRLVQLNFCSHPTSLASVPSSFLAGAVLLYPGSLALAPPGLLGARDRCGDSMCKRTGKQTG